MALSKSNETYTDIAKTTNRVHSHVKLGEEEHIDFIRDDDFRGGWYTIEVQQPVTAGNQK